MGRRRRRIFKWLSFVIAILLFIQAGQKFLFRNMEHNQRRIDGFYMEKKDTLDVVLLGSSEVYSDFSCAQAYDEYGFTSYPYAVGGNTVKLWKYELQEIIDHQHPQLILVETNGALYNNNFLIDESKVHLVADQMPFSRNKIAMVRNCGPEEGLSYFMPILKYHSRWESIKNLRKGARNMMALCMQGCTYLKGVECYSDKYDLKDMLDISGDTSKAPLDPEAEAALNDFMDYCRENATCPVVFVRFPHIITEGESNYKRFQRNNTVAEIVKENGFDYIDLDAFLDEMDLDLEEDFFNGEHMNANGMKKMTSWFGRYLRDTYGIHPKPQTADNQKRWETSVQYTKALYRFFEKLKEKGINTEVYENKKLMDQLKTML